jgi:hypothetical protein
MDTSPRLPSISSRAPRGRTENLLLPKQACSHLHLCPNRQRVVSRKLTAVDGQSSLLSTFSCLLLCGEAAWTCRELNPEALIASQSADPSASPSFMSVTRVGFEPDLAGLKDQRPHQKSNEPKSVIYVRTPSAVVSKVFLPAAYSVDWEVLEPSSAVLQTAARPSQLPVHLIVKRWK